MVTWDCIAMAVLQEVQKRRDLCVKGEGEEGLVGVKLGGDVTPNSSPSSCRGRRDSVREQGGVTVLLLNFVFFFNF